MQNHEYFFCGMERFFVIWIYFKKSCIKKRRIISKKKDGCLCCHSMPGGSKILKKLSLSVHIQINVWKNEKNLFRSLKQLILIQKFEFKDWCKKIKPIDLKFCSDGKNAVVGYWRMRRRKLPKSVYYTSWQKRPRAVLLSLKSLIQNCSAGTIFFVQIAKKKKRP